MQQDPPKKLLPYPNIRNLLAGIPRDLWSIFLPETNEDLSEFETNIVVFRSREPQRDQVMAIQRRYRLKLRPNETLRAARIKARIRSKGRRSK